MIPISKATRCPGCSSKWSYSGSDGKSYSYITAMVDQDLDRVVEWMCPTCGQTWPRNAMIDEEVSNL